MRCVLLRLFGLVVAMSGETNGQPHRAMADGWAMKEGFGGAVTACQHTKRSHDGTLGGQESHGGRIRRVAWPNGPSARQSEKLAITACCPARNDPGYLSDLKTCVSSFCFLLCVFVLFFVLFFAWSYDGGETWVDADFDELLPDGPRYRGQERRGSNYNDHFGMMCSLTRLPVQGRDILLYSNADTPSHRRVRMTVWASFDAGKSWPVKRLVHDGPSAYSSLTAGRPRTPSAGWIYLQFEGGEKDTYAGAYLARFSLTWLLNGETTGQAEVPQWVTQ